jgi:hypothetical protein
MKLRFTWHEADDGPAGLPEARRRLLSAGGTWSPAEPEALARFLHEQLRLVQAAEQEGGAPFHPVIPDQDLLGAVRLRPSLQMNTLFYPKLP